jgi:hypothetical protein
LPAHTSILAHLAFRLTSQTENLATEALLHVLRSSPAAHSAFVDLARAAAGGPALDVVSFRSQGGDAADQSIPDLVGVNAVGVQVLLVENKFWAGLTGNQPVRYLERLPVGGGVLLFVAPERRLSQLWGELRTRCRDERVVLGPTEGEGEGRFAIVAGGRVLAVTSWRAVIRQLLTRVEAAGEVSIANDLLQLQGLCDAMDSQAFLPLTSEELTGTLGLRVVQFSELVDGIVPTLLGEGLATKEGLRATGSRGYYGHYLWVHGYGCLLAFSANRWAQFGITPIWLRITSRSWDPLPTLGPALQTLLPDMNVIQHEDGTLVAIRLMTGMGREAVIKRALEQLRQVIGALGNVPAPQSSAKPLPPPEPDGAERSAVDAFGRAFIEAQE